MTPLVAKAWRESRVRFLLCVVVLLGAVSEFVLHVRTAFPPPEAPALPYTAFVWGNLIGNRQPLVFAVMALVLGLGGLQRERAAGTAAFTLVLPVTRRALVATRVLVGLVEVLVLAFAPFLAVPLLGPLAGGHAYPLDQAARFGLLYAGWGVVFFAVGVLWSTLLRGALSAFTACILTPFVYLIAVASRVDESGGWADANFATFMSGIAYFDRTRGRESVLGGVFPWASLLVLGLAAAAIVAVAHWRTLRQDF